MKEQIKKHILTIKTFLKNAHIPFALFLEVVIGLIAIIGLLVIFLHLSSEVFEKDFSYLDLSIIHFVYGLRNPFLTLIMIGISFIGEQGLIAVSFLFLVYILIKKYYREAVLFSLTFIMGVVLNMLLKLLYHRSRPLFAPLVHETNFSYPSGHAMNSFVFFTYMSYFVYRFTKNKTYSLLFTVLSGIFVLLIGISRVYLGVYYPSDVIAGYIAGLLWFGIVVLLEKTILFYRLFRNYRFAKKTSK